MKIRIFPSIMSCQRRPVSRRWASALLIALLSLTGCGDSSRPPNVVLILIDTLRADFLSTYGHPQLISPAMDALASEGVLFERVIAPSSWTKTSMASIFTSRSPAGHGVRSAEHVLPSALVTIAEGFQQAGYRTVAVNGNPWITTDHGFAAGFDHFDFLGFHATAREVNERALEVLSTGTEEPFLLYIHYLDPHAPYHPSRDYFDEDPLEIPGQGTLPDFKLEHLYRKLKIDGPEIRKRVRDLYAAEVRQVDDRVSELVAALRERRLIDNAVVLLTSDHGESFHEHGTVMHGVNLFPEVVQVPLILYAPGRLPAGARIPSQVRSIDIAPTLFELAGIEIPPTFEGQSLLPIDPERRQDRTAFSAVGLHDKVRDKDFISIRTGEHLYIRERRGDTVEFYDLERDPDALVNLGPDHALVEHFAELERRQTAEEASILAIDEEMQEQLRALGYLSEAK